MAGARAWILDQLDAERSRWMLWLPVALGLGIAVYFELPSEPALWLGPALAAGAMVLAFFAPAGSLARAVAIGLVAAAVGFGLIAWRTANLAAPTLSRLLFNINVEGRIADIQRLPEGVRVVLEAVRLKGSGVPAVESLQGGEASRAFCRPQAAEQARRTPCWRFTISLAPRAQRRCRGLPTSSRMRAPQR